MVCNPHTIILSSHSMTHILTSILGCSLALLSSSSLAFVETQIGFACLSDNWRQTHDKQTNKQTNKQQLHGVVWCCLLFGAACCLVGCLVGWLVGWFFNQSHGPCCCCLFVTHDWGECFTNACNTNKRPRNNDASFVLCNRQQISNSETGKKQVVT
jgi:hypothetical protein